MNSILAGGTLKLVDRLRGIECRDRYPRRWEALSVQHALVWLGRKGWEDGRVADHGVVLNTSRLLSAALAPVLEKRGLSVLTSPENGSDLVYVEVVQCGGGALDGWTRLKRNDDLNRVGYVAIIDQVDLETYRRAYHLGAAVVLDDVDPDAAADIILARLAGEIRVPAGLLSTLLGNDRRALSELERVVMSQLADGRTVAEVAEAQCYSDRHVRRILNTILAKAGTRNRQEAFEFFREELGH